MSSPRVFGIEKNMIIIFGVTLIAVMGIASITPAFPGIIQYFGISTQQVGWLIAAFTLPGVFLTPVTGILADRLGRKLVLVPSLLSERLAASSVQIGLMMSVMSLVTAATSSQLGKINKRFHSKTILLMGTSFYFLAMLSLLISHSWIQVVASVMVFGLGHGLLIPSIQNLLVGFASIKERAAFMSVSSMVLRIGQTLGPLVIGLFYVMGGLQGSILAGAMVAVVMFGVIAGMVKK